MATTPIPISGGRASGGSTFTPDKPTGTEASTFEETLQRELTGTAGDPGATFGTQAHFNSLNLASLADAKMLYSGDAQIGKFTADGYNVSDLTKEGATDWQSAKTTGYRIGRQHQTGGFDIPGQKDIKGFYKVDTAGKFQGMDFEDTSTKAAVADLAVALGPMAGAFAPGLGNAIAGATGLSPFVSNLLGRGLIGGSLSAATGGKFGTGFLGGAVTAGLNPAISSFANQIGGQGTGLSALLGAGGRLGVSAALNGGRLTPTAVVGTLLDSLGKPKAPARAR